MTEIRVKCTKCNKQLRTRWARENDGVIEAFPCGCRVKKIPAAYSCDKCGEFIVVDQDSIFEHEDCRKLIVMAMALHEKMSRENRRGLRRMHALDPDESACGAQQAETTEMAMMMIESAAMKLTPMALRAKMRGRRYLGIHEIRDLMRLMSKG